MRIPEPISRANQLSRLMFGWGLLVALALLPLLLLGITAYWILSRSVRDMVDSNNASAAQISAELLGRDLQRSASLAEAFATLPGMVEAVHDRDAAAVRTRLQVLVKSTPSADRASLLDPEGMMWSDFPYAPESLGRSWAHRDYYQGPKRTGAPIFRKSFAAMRRPSRWWSAFRRQSATVGSCLVI